ncbi:PAS domain S-box-containing protein [Chitinophaga jiangningensis]|uniref:histidine kinase n=1 Tax=Chitinophaga jiangningensis TaxID=1419482 RepID=A0A1M7DRS5_9BACT|nr:PAS domain-containing protein [Chitinophaga jiangningensis]SHL82204.1 PAS domain S-box-containing protein [Chitinophaga jiangningensis]
MQKASLKIVIVCLLLIVAGINGYFLIAAQSGTLNIAVHSQYLLLCNELLLIAVITVLTVMTIRKNNHSLQYERLFFDHPIPMWIYDKNTLRFMSVNNAAISKYGYSRKEFYNLTLKDIRDKEEVPFLMRNIEERCNGVEYRGIWKHRKKNGSNFFVEIYAHSVTYRGKEARFIMAKDVDDQVRAAQRASAEGVRYELLAQATNDAVYDRNLVTGVIAWNHGLSSIFQYDNNKFTEVLQWWKNNIHPDDKQLVMNSLENTLLANKRYWSAEYRFRCADGSFKYISDRANISYEGHMAVRMIGMMQDIDQHIRQAQLLEEQNKTLKEITWINSHEIRRPVVSILSITQLFDKENKDIQLNSQLMEWLHQSTLQLDEIIHKIERKARQINDDPPTRGLS